MVEAPDMIVSGAPWKHLERQDWVSRKGGTSEGGNIWIEA